MIAFVCHPYHRGGVTSWIKEAVDAAGPLGIECRLVTVRPERIFISGKLRPAMVDFVESTSSIIAEKVGWLFELGTFAYRVGIYRNLIERHIPLGWMLIPSDDEACWAACAQLANCYKVVGVLHSDDTYYYDVLQRYKSFLAAATGVSQRIVTKANMGALPHAVIPCGINTSQYGPAEKEQLIVWVGRLEERQKRVTDIVPIAKALQRYDAGLQIEVYGHGEMDRWLAEQIAEHGLVNLRLMGWQDTATIAKAMGRAKVLLQTSEFEGMSVAVMEALASGCIIVSSRVSGVEDVEHQAGFENLMYLFEVGHVDAAVQMIESALGHWTHNATVRAVEVAANTFSIKSCLRQYVELDETIRNSDVSHKPINNIAGSAMVSGVIAFARKLKYNISSLFSA